MLHRPIITLTTDFGYNDPFAGVMKAVILKINPDANIIDLTHGIKPHDIRDAAFTIGMNYEYFPAHTIHIVVVDPGVGSNRRPIIVMTDRHFFIGPDNGVFSYIYTMNHETLQVLNITAEHYFLSSESATFQGRDVFAPTAAYISRGINILNFGDVITDYQTIKLPSTEIIGEKSLRGEVIHIDRFGNAITNIRSSDIDMIYSSNPKGNIDVSLNNMKIPLKNYYAEVKDKGLYSLVNSSGYLEIFVYRGNAALENKISAGDTVEIALAEKPV